MTWLKTYDEEYRELHSHLTEEWEMKPQYAQAFLDAYKKSIGKMLAKGKKRSSRVLESADPAARLFHVAYVEDHNFALVAQAYRAYMSDLRRGRHVGTSVEKTIWAILVNRSDLLEALDRPFSMYISESHEEMFPALFGEVFSESSP